ncbi:MAG: hypothetical protein NT104_03620 [Bacteroidetes bacterium]|nr:hypothetical protein [Bacteroidota bacterium]
MKKNQINKSIIPLCLFFLFVLNACKKEHEVPNFTDANLSIKSLDKKIPVVESTKMVTAGDPQVQDLLNSNNILETGLSLENVIFYKIKFKGLSSLAGIHIVLQHTDSLSKDLFYVVDLNTKTDLAVVREKIGFNKTNYGRIIFKEPNGREYANNYFNNQKIIADPLANIENSLNKFAVTNQKNIKSNLAWSCTSAQFNSYYQEAKNTCENDWLCDFACNFNPCAISYVAYAVGRCSGAIK